MQKTTRILLSTFTLLALMFGGFASPTSTVSAAGAITVNTAADNVTDDNLCTLREAITNANDDAQTYDDCATGSGVDTITFAGDYTITLGSTMPQVTTEMTIDGTGQSVSVSGNDTYRVFNVSAAGDLTINALMIANGSAGSGGGGGIENYGTLTVTNSALSGNSGSQGGGIANYGTATVSNSTFSDNISNGGGGIYNSGTLTVTNSTFSGNNTFESVGGGIYNNSGTLMVTNSTFSGNYADVAGGGIYNMSGTVYLAGTIFAGSTGGNCLNNGGTFIDIGYNLSDDPSCGFSGTSANNATLNLGTLADNGGPTETHALLPGSGAIDGIPYDTTINNNGVIWTCNDADPFTDQRGVARPQGTGCDSGAFEQTQSLVVTKAADTDDGVCDTDCSLREAINNADPGTTITFAGDYTITLGSALPDITEDLTIDGNGAANTIIQASTCDPINLPGGCTPATWRVFYINSGSATTLKDLTVRYGKITGTEGAGIYLNAGSLTLTNVEVSNNKLAQIYDTRGAGIYNNNGSLTISNSRIINNWALTGFFSSEGSFGGGIFTTGGTVSITDSLFSGNVAGNNEGLEFPSNGGGIYKAGGTLTISNSTFSGNSASSSVNPRNGGAIYNQSGAATISNSTFYSNSANGGYGGAIYNNSGLTLINSTLSNNQIGSGTGGALYNSASGGLTLKNSILANSSGSGLDCVSDTALASEANNLIEANGGCGSPASTADPMLGSLADNGGSAQTMALLPDSPAIDAGDNTTCANSPVNNLDQRGVARPQGAHCDIGAFEVQAQIGPDFIVNSNADTDDGVCAILTENDCTLREAINAANANADASTITFAGDYTITLGSALPQISTEMTIDGMSQSVTVSGNDTYRVFNVSAAGNLTVNKLTIANGSADNGGGIYNQGTLNVTNSTFHSNSATLLGGGLFNAASGTTLTNVTFSDNSAFVGGGLTTESSNVTLINATFSNNSATSSGGAMALDNASATITNVIITNSTIGNNCSFNNGGSIAGSSSYNLIDDTSCGLTDGINNNMIGASYDAMLGSLADNGGPTNTHALLAGSDAIDAGDDAVCADTGTVNNLDQRGVTRPQGSRCDIGAYEFTSIFADVSPTHWALRYIESLYNAGITGGCGGGNYCPDNQVTRAQMAVFLLRGIHGSGYTPPAATGTVFNDVGAGDFAAAWIEQMVSEGITSGCGGGNYCPNATVTRAQMAVFLLRAKYGSGYTPPAATGTVFTDVPLGSFGAAWIEQLVSEGVTSGCGGGNYCPNAPVTRAQMAVFLVRIFNLP